MRVWPRRIAVAITSPGAIDRSWFSDLPRKGDCLPTVASVEKVELSSASWTDGFWFSRFGTSQ